MKLLPTLLSQITGGVAASYVDRAKPEWTRHVAGIAISPGAIASIGTAIALALLPGSIAGSTVKSVLANMAGGGLVYEGVKLAEAEILPRLPAGFPGSTALPAGASPMMMTAGAGAMFPYAYRPMATDYELQQALARYRRAA